MKKNFKLSVIGILMVGMGSLLPVGSAWAASGIKIGTVDMQRALQNVDEGRAAKAQLEREFNAKKRELQKEEAEIKKMGEAFKKQSLVMSDDARMKKQNEIQERILKFQQLTAQSQAMIQQKEHDLTQPIIDKLKVIVNNVAKQKGYTLVLEKSENTVLYSQQQDDLTDDVIAKFNSESKAQMDSIPKSNTSRGDLDRAGTVSPNS